MFWWIVLAILVAVAGVFAVRRAAERRRRHAVRIERQGIRQQRLDEWEEDIRRRTSGK